MMRQPPRRALAPLGLSLLSACGAERWVDRGIGGTGGIADRGIGGTGINGGLVDRGIGGTGIGGLGLIGTVTAFGSIWVNGVRLALPERLRVTREGAPATAADIKLGQVVMARAGGLADGETEALAVDLRVAVAGPVESRDADTLWVLGQRCAIEQAVADEALRAAQPGHLVAVSGLRRPDGAIAVSRVDPWPAARGWLLRGTLDSGGLVAGVPVALAPGVAFPADAQGKEWRATGNLAAAPLLAETLRLEPANPFGGAVGRILLETYLDAAGRAPSALGAPAITLGEPGMRVVYAARVIDLSGALAPSGAAPAAMIGQRGLPGGGFGRVGPGQGSGQGGPGGSARGGAAMPGTGGAGMAPGQGPGQGAGQGGGQGAGQGPGQVPGQGPPPGAPPPPGMPGIGRAPPPPPPPSFVPPAASRR